MNAHSYRADRTREHALREGEAFALPAGSRRDENERPKKGEKEENEIPGWTARPTGPGTK